MKLRPTRKIGNLAAITLSLGTLAACGGNTSSMPTSVTAQDSGLLFVSPQMVRAQAAVAVNRGAAGSEILVFAMGNEKNKPPFCKIDKKNFLAGPLSVGPDENFWVPYKPIITAPDSAVAEYKPSCGPEVLTLKDQDAQASDLAVAQNGTVYVANSTTGYDSPGDVLVYPKGQSTPSKLLGSREVFNPYGVAVDLLNNVYVEYRKGSSEGVLVFQNARGPGHRLKDFTTETPGKIVFDKSENLIVPSAYAMLDVYAPPYNAKPKSYALRSPSVQCALNAAQSTLACTGFQNKPAVDVYSYPALTYRYSFDNEIHGQFGGVAESPL
jgi:hypothetical protein